MYGTNGTNGTLVRRQRGAGRGTLAHRGLLQRTNVPGMGSTDAYPQPSRRQLGGRRKTKRCQATRSPKGEGCAECRMGKRRLVVDVSGFEWRDGTEIPERGDQLRSGGGCVLTRLLKAFLKLRLLGLHALFELRVFGVQHAKGRPCRLSHGVDGSRPCPLV